jgi:Ca2+-transporting ATPase
MQLGHVLAIRSERTSLLRLGLGTNRPLLGAVILTVLLQLAVIYVPALSALFGTVPLTAAELAGTFAAGGVILAVVEVEKWLRRQRARNDASTSRASQA